MRLTLGFRFLSVPLFFAIPNSNLDASWEVPVTSTVAIFLIFGGLTTIGPLLSVRTTFSAR